VALAAVLSNAVENSRPVLQAKSHHLSVDLPDETVIVDVDIVRLAQVFTNLLNNAARYTPAAGKIGIHARREEDQLVVAISDNGLGIAKPELERIFEPFFQAGRASDSPSGGLGVGLTLVKQLIGLHRGTVEATSAGKGKGSTFIVKLPCRLPVSPV
jgi:signal transduction histidine kinase